MNHYGSIIIFSALFLAVATPLVATQAPAWQAPEGEPWTIREVIRGDVAEARHIDSITDIDGDGVLDFMAWLGPDSPQNAGMVFRGGDLSMLQRMDNLFINIYYRLGTGVALKTPTGLRLAVGQRFGNPGVSQFFIFEGTPPRRTAVIPPPPPQGGPSQYSLFGVFPAGDLDGDGYDEVLLNLGVSLGWTSTAILDGATLTYKWVNDYPISAWSGAMTNRHPEPYQDIDGDGIKDIWVSFQSGSQGGDWHTRCLSGVDGHEIWTDIRTTGQTPTAGKLPAVIDDANGDGIYDLFFTKHAEVLQGEPGFFRVISGLDGSLVWEVPLEQYNPGASESPPWDRIGTKAYAVHTGDYDGDGVADIAVGMAEAPLPQGVFSSEYRIWMISGSNGDLLLREAVDTASRQPWDNDVIDSLGALFPIGDIDNDGWAELYGRNWDPMTVPGSLDFFIYGRTTLRHPKQAREGDLIDLGIHIPTGANKPFKIVFSTGFDAMQNGFFASGVWNTHLVDTPLLRSSVHASRLSGILDGEGKSKVKVSIPAGLGLAGQTLYGVAFIQDLSRPGGILTKSSFAVIEVLP
ncbi:MAG: hypothetical protein COA70_10115 [Planctomycetota bacterium]|nr:MAG: hypothetical protein COA70_10115 [Planctomycetota bacterium]